MGFCFGIIKEMSYIASLPFGIIKEMLKPLFMLLWWHNLETCVNLGPG